MCFSVTPAERLESGWEDKDAACRGEEALHSGGGDRGKERGLVLV